MVTGASGFIGRVLCEKLQANGVRVRALMRNANPGPWQETVSVDLRVQGCPAAAMKSIDTVFHLAGKVHALSETDHADDEYSRVNVGGTRLLLDAAQSAGVRRFMFFSSVKAMGEGGDACLGETYPPAPKSAYGRSKLEAERAVLDKGRETSMHVVVLRPALVYGRGNKGNLERMLRAVEAGRFPPLQDNGNRRSMVHVEDVVEAAILACITPEAAGQIYLITDGHADSTREIYNMMCDALGKAVPSWSVPQSFLQVLAGIGDAIGRVRGTRFPFDSDALEKLTGSAWYSSAKVERELGFRPTRTLRDALPEMITQLREAA